MRTIRVFGHAVNFVRLTREQQLSTWLGLDYSLAETPLAPPELVARVVGQFRNAGY